MVVKEEPPLVRFIKIHAMPVIGGSGWARTAAARDGARWSASAMLGWVTQRAAS